MEKPQLTEQDLVDSEEVEEALQLSQKYQDEIAGSLEAIGGDEAIVVNEDETVPLTEHQLNMVSAFKELNKPTNAQVYAVVDNAALEGFVEFSKGMVNKALKAFLANTPIQFKLTSKALFHYVEMAKKTKQRLTELRPLLEKREYPILDIYEYKAYKRFFTLDGKAITRFSEFNEAALNANRSMLHTLASAEAYAVPTSGRLLKSLQFLRLGNKHDANAINEIVTGLAESWKWQWKEAKITDKHGQTPRDVINKFPERRFTSLSPLLDSRYLVAYESKYSSNAINALVNYGAQVVFDPIPTAKYGSEMNMPNCRELLTLVDTVCATLNDFQGLISIAKKNDRYAKEFKQISDQLTHNLSKDNGSENYSFMTDYFKVVNAIAANLKEPYVGMSWNYIRMALVVVALVEHAVLVDQKDKVVTERFFVDKKALFSNPAMESMESTRKALETIAAFKQ